MAGGRPSKYDPMFCKKLIAHMSKGLSFDSFAAVAKVNLDTLYEWAKVHSEFSEAKKQAFNENLLFWENAGVDGMHDKEKFNSTVWIFNMKNRHNWRDKRDVVTTTLEDKERERIQQMDMKELTELVKRSLKE